MRVHRGWVAAGLVVLLGASCSEAVPDDPRLAAACTAGEQVAKIQREVRDGAVTSVRREAAQTAWRAALAIIERVAPDERVRAAADTLGQAALTVSDASWNAQQQAAYAVVRQAMQDRCGVSLPE